MAYFYYLISNFELLQFSHHLFYSFHNYKNPIIHLFYVDYDILFQQGGATLQFTAVPLNLANNYQRIGYIDTGHWSQRAYQEAELLHKFDVDVVASSKDSNYTELVHQVELENKNYDYVHLTSNNTIEGTMYRKLPSGLAGQTVVADMSSNILGQK